MSRFIETIRAENGITGSLDLHQERVNRTLRDWGADGHVDLSETLGAVSIPAHPVCRVRVEYDLSGILQVSFFEYVIKSIRNIRLVDIGGREYRYKYADREWIHSLVHTSGCDEIIMMRDNWITDASIANLAFYNGAEWITSDTPLFQGTRRQYLLENGLIREAPVRRSDLSSFHLVKLINAMIPWTESPELPISMVRG
jgi:4-amino-4-deoxychorismate lyase